MSSTAIIDQWEENDGETVTVTATINDDDSILIGEQRERLPLPADDDGLTEAEEAWIRLSPRAARGLLSLVIHEQAKREMSGV